MANQLPAIKHIVQLMLENRSFDQMLGFLYHPANTSPASQPFDGLTGNETNPDGAGGEIPVFRIDDTAPHPYLVPGADPGEGFHNTNFQLFSTDDPAPGAVPDNKGFVYGSARQSRAMTKACPDEPPARIEIGSFAGDIIANRWACWSLDPLSRVTESADI